MTRYDDTIYIVGLQSLYNVGAIRTAFHRGFWSPYDAREAVKKVENQSLIHIFLTLINVL